MSHGESKANVASVRQNGESRMNRIARRAHEIYETRAGQNGTAMEDWLAAERQIDDEIDHAERGSNSAGG